MKMSRRIATFALGALFAGALAAGCAGSSKQTASDDKTAADGESKNTVDCKQLADEAEKQEDGSKSTDQLVMEATGPVATVDGHDITAAEFNAFARRRMPLQHRKMPKPLADRIKRKMTQKLVERRLIERALDDASVRVEKSDLESLFLDFKSRFPDKEALQAFLDQRNLNQKDIKAQLCRDVQMQQYLEDKYAEEVDEEAVSDYYEDNKSEFERPEKVKASHILIRVPKDASPETIEKKKKKAQKLAEKARKDEVDFAKLAKKHSEGPSASRGGQLGYFSHRRMVAEFSKVAFNMTPGEISDPVRTKFGFHIIEMHDKKAAQTQSLEEARPQIKRRLQQQSQRTAMHRFLEDAKKDTTIEYHLENIELNTKPSEGGGQSLDPPPGGMQ